MANGKHAALIRRLGSSGCSVRCFWKSLRDGLCKAPGPMVCDVDDEEERDWLKEEFDEAISGVKRHLLPDAFVVDVGRQHVDCYEVEVNHKLSTAKAIEYGALVAELDAFEWTLDVLIVDRFGTQTRLRGLGFYFAWIMARWQGLSFDFEDVDWSLVSEFHSSEKRCGDLVQDFVTFARSNPWADGFVPMFPEPA